MLPENTPRPRKVGEVLVYAEVAHDHREAIESARRAVAGDYAFPSQVALVAIDEAMRSLTDDR